MQIRESCPEGRVVGARLQFLEELCHIAAAQDGRRSGVAGRVVAYHDLTTLPPLVHGLAREVNCQVLGSGFFSSFFILHGVGLCRAHTWYLYER